MGFLNLPIGTMGGAIWWDTLERRNGWKLQQHKITGHYRILDYENIRQAWGNDYLEIINDFRKFTKNI